MWLYVKRGILWIVEHSIKITMERLIEELITETHIIFYDISSNRTKSDMLTTFSMTSIFLDFRYTV